MTNTPPSPPAAEPPGFAPHIMKTMSAQNALIDPAFIDLWGQFEHIQRRGIRFVGQLQPRDAVADPEPGPANFHAVPTLVLGLSGITRVGARQTISLLPGELALIEPGVWHHHLAHAPGSAHLGVGFFGGRCDLFWSSHGFSLWGWVPEEPYVGLVRKLMHASADVCRHELADDIFSSLSHERIYSVDFPKPQIWNMVREVWTHGYEQRYGIEDMIEQTGMSRSKVFIHLRNVFGRSPKQEVLSNRISVAHHLIQRGMTVTEAAKCAGFSCRSDLTRAYRRIHGCAPTLGAFQAATSVVARTS